MFAYNANFGNLSPQRNMSSRSIASKFKVQFLSTNNIIYYVTIIFQESWQIRHHSYLHKVMGVNRWTVIYSHCIGKEIEALKCVRVF